MKIKLPERLETFRRKFSVGRDQKTGVFLKRINFTAAEQFRSGFRIPVKDPAWKNRLRIKPVVNIGKTTFPHSDVKGFPRFG